MDGALLINNNRIETEQKITSINPATLEPMGDVCLATEEHCQEAVQAAKDAFAFWKETPGNTKRQVFKHAKKILLQKSVEIATLITEEHGSPLPESLSMEIWSAAEALDYYADCTDKNLSPQKMRSRVVLFILLPWGRRSSSRPGIFPFCSLYSMSSAPSPPGTQSSSNPPHPHRSLHPRSGMFLWKPGFRPAF